MIGVGDAIPNLEVRTMGLNDLVRPLASHDVLGKGRVVLLGARGAFTKVDSRQFLPGYLADADEFRARGVDLIACISVNDVWVMDAWGRDQRVGEKILMVGDGGARFTQAIGTDLPYTTSGGVRSKRYTMVINDGVVTHFAFDPGIEVGPTSAKAVLAEI